MTAKATDNLHILTLDDIKAGVNRTPLSASLGLRNAQIMAYLAVVFTTRAKRDIKDAFDGVAVDRAHGDVRATLALENDPEAEDTPVTDFIEDVCSETLKLDRFETSRAVCAELYSIEEIRGAVALASGVSREDLLKKSEDSHVTNAKRALAYMSTRLTDRKPSALSVTLQLGTYKISNVKRHFNSYREIVAGASEQLQPAIPSAQTLLENPDLDKRTTFTTFEA